MMTNDWVVAAAGAVGGAAVGYLVSKGFGAKKHAAMASGVIGAVTGALLLPAASAAVTAPATPPAPQITQAPPSPQPAAVAVVGRRGSPVRGITVGSIGRV